MGIDDDVRGPDVGGQEGQVLLPDAVGSEPSRLPVFELLQYRCDGGEEFVVGKDSWSVGEGDGDLGVLGDGGGEVTFGGGGDDALAELPGIRQQQLAVVRAVNGVIGLHDVSHAGADHGCCHTSPVIRRGPVVENGQGFQAHPVVDGARNADGFIGPVGPHDSPFRYLLSGRQRGDCGQGDDDLGEEVGDHIWVRREREPAELQSVEDSVDPLPGNNTIQGDGD